MLDVLVIVAVGGTAWWVQCLLEDITSLKKERDRLAAALGEAAARTEEAA